MAARIETEPMKRSAIQQLPFWQSIDNTDSDLAGILRDTPASEALPYRFVTLWSELRTPWRAAFEEAWTAYRAGSLPMGAVVVDRDGGILGRGRIASSRPPRSKPKASVSSVTGWPMRRSTR
jgi:hypothetical protein